MKDKVSNQFNNPSLYNTMLNILQVIEELCSMMRWPPSYTSSYNMINSTTDREEGNHDLETIRSLRAPDLCLARPLEIQRCHSEVAAPHTSAHTSVYHFKQLGHTTNGERAF